MDAPVDTVGPWTIKAVPTATKNKVITAARKEALTVGQWLERRVNEWLADGAPVNVPPAPAAIDDLCRLTEAAAKLAEYRERMPKGLAGALGRRLREAVRPPKPAPARKQIAAPEQ
jgi:hypothetical protein